MPPKVFRMPDDPDEITTLLGAYIGCPVCGREIDTQFEYCPSCGQRIKWEQR